ncbi:Gfo/Idh/MocA family protein [Pollutimonas thiosulfatoxidans]|uniref:Oxidoreductase n=1 Tax=Pollutimonas thiosulfatoxidans TaxID=2028345 RepID=A0A410GEI5_9BURK|nr:Gfo/Idh/MocA family oxidoreductase [Pollutimonas thiosulfatoxidans]QAA94710.1 hypothetical protein CKA81_13310 [Pollutimonas thiosulfatoxidans]
MTPRRFLVVGSGSIARRHIDNLRLFFPGSSVGCVSASGRQLSGADVGVETVRYVSVAEAVKSRPSFAIVASPAPLHGLHAAELLRNDIPVLIEKPLSSSVETLKDQLNVLYENEHRVDIAYNLRNLLAAQKVKTIIESQQLGRIYSVLAEVGQYLPDWRPKSDYRKNVSARKELGGGVLLELSHELDYISWLFGEVERVYCVASTSGALEIDVEDNVDAILNLKSGLIVNLHMDFLQRSPERRCKIIGQNGTVIWDVLHNSIILSSGGRSEELFRDECYDRNDMYMEEIVHFDKVASGNANPKVGLRHALAVLSVVDALHLSSQTKMPVEIGTVE